MFYVLIGKENADLNIMFDQIQNINNENVKIFETVTDHIIQSNFDFQNNMIFYACNNELIPSRA